MGEKRIDVRKKLLDAGIGGSVQMLLGRAFVAQATIDKDPDDEAPGTTTIAIIGTVLGYGYNEENDAIDFTVSAREVGDRLVSMLSIDVKSRRWTLWLEDRDYSAMLDWL